MDKIEKAIGVMFMSRTYAHMAHLKTASFAKHKALNEFYDEIVELADDLAEAAQGKFGLLDIEVMDMKGDPDDPVGALKSHVTMIENLGKKCEERYLQNIVDEIIATYYSTIYKLENLK